MNDEIKVVIALEEIILVDDIAVDILSINDVEIIVFSFDNIFSFDLVVVVVIVTTDGAIVVVVISPTITTPGSPLPIELIATTENV